MYILASSPVLSVQLVSWDGMGGAGVDFNIKLRLLLDLNLQLHELYARHAPGRGICRLSKFTRCHIYPSF